MARICDICEKGYHRAHLVPRGIGRRVTKRTLRKQHPNLRTVKMAIEEGGNKVKLKICSGCLKRMKKDKRDFELAKETSNE